MYYLPYFQVLSLSSKGLSAACITGEATDTSVKDGVTKGAYQLVFFTPEMIITNKRWRKMISGDLYTKQLKAFVVDEAHCVKKWYVKYLRTHSVKHSVRVILKFSQNNYDIYC